MEWRDLLERRDVKLVAASQRHSLKSQKTFPRTLVGAACQCLPQVSLKPQRPLQA